MRTRALVLVLVLVTGMLASSCGGDGVLLDRDGAVPSGPTLAMLQQGIFTPRCAVDGCHAGPGAQQGLDLSEGRAWAHLVHVPSTENASVLRVSPGDPDGSYLVWKLSGDARMLGERMPFGGPYLSSAEIDAVRGWIRDGARDD
jgi:hypothetical protein